MGTLVFCSAGFLLAAAFFLRCRRLFFPEAGRWWCALGVLVMGLGSFVQFELRSARFYEVPIACAFACAMGAAHAVLSAARSGSGRGRVLGMLAASALCGAAVGSRPNFVFGLTPLGGVALALAWPRWRERGVGSREAWAVLLAAVAPAALIGAGLAAYNYVRFGSVSEFGLKYQFAAIDMRDFPLFGCENFLPGLHAYLAASKEWSLYYPFLRQAEDAFGVVPWAPFAILALFFPFVRAGDEQARGAWRLGVGFLFGLALVNLTSLFFYSYRLCRYELDFLPAAMLVALLTTSVLRAGRTGGRSWLGRCGRWGAMALLGVTLAQSLIQGLPTGTDLPEVRLAARLLETPAWAIERLAGRRQGAVAMEIEFPAAASGRKEPLVATADGRDLVYVSYAAEGSLQFGFYHVGAGGPLGPAVRIAPGTRHRVVVETGGLYPPKEYPDFAAWSDLENALLHRRVRVSVDGRVVLAAASDFYPSDPWRVTLGWNPVPPPFHEARFSGRILGLERLGLPSRRELTADTSSGPVRLVVRFPEFRAMVGQPLVSTGRNGAGDLVYVFYLGPGKARFGHDSWNGAAVETEPVFFDPSEDQIIEVDMGSLHPGAPDLQKYSHRFRLRFNGRELISVPRPFHPSSPSEVAFGYNAIGASTAEVLFGGGKIETERLRNFPEVSGLRGAFHLTLQLPRGRAGRQEPLLVTGRPGAGDLVYIVYPDNEHVRIGFDHWGSGGPLSEPLAAPAGSSVELDVSLGCLYPPGDPQPAGMDPATQASFRKAVQVRLNGRIVLQHEAETFPAAADEIAVGRNPIGGSTCDPEFTGRILKVERTDPPRLR